MKSSCWKHDRGWTEACSVVYIYMYLCYTLLKIRHPDLSFNLLTNQLISYRLCSRNESWEGILGEDLKTDLKCLATDWSSLPLLTFDQGLLTVMLLRDSNEILLLEHEEQLWLWMLHRHILYSAIWHLCWWVVGCEYEFKCRFVYVEYTTESPQWYKSSVHPPC